MACSILCGCNDWPLHLIFGVELFDCLPAAHRDWHRYPPVHMERKRYTYSSRYRYDIYIYYIHDIIFILFQSKVPINNMTLGLIGYLQPNRSLRATSTWKGVDANGQRRFLCSLDLTKGWRAAATKRWRSDHIGSVLVGILWFFHLGKFPGKNRSNTPYMDLT